MLSKDLEQTLNDAFRGAREKRHEFMTVEHLLLALLDNNDAIKVLKACGADIGSLRGDLVEFVDATTPDGYVDAQSVPGAEIQAIASGGDAQYHLIGSTINMPVLVQS